MVIAVFKIDQEGAVLKVDEVKFIHQLIFTDRFSVFQALFFSGSAGNRIDIIFFGYADLGVNIGLPFGSGLIGIPVFTKWLDELRLFFGGFHFLHHAHFSKIVNGASSDSVWVALSVTKYIQPGAGHWFTYSSGRTLVNFYLQITCEPVTY
jgi:hypothetical protein